MRVPTLFCAVFALYCASRTAMAQFATCDEEYECTYQASTVDDITFSFDLRPLCEQGNTYLVNDSTGHNYSFNICGTSSFECVPSWTNVYQTGVAVQYWGDVPPCNANTTNCTDYRGENVCCTQDCQVLGVGIPNWSLKDPKNPETGGLLITHIGVPPSDDDPFWCPWNPNTGAMYERTITYDFKCNYQMPFGTLNILGVAENATVPCQYTIYLESFHGCGCSPNCANKNCGPDGCGYTCGTDLYGLCPDEYTCLEDGICCKPDCNGRSCGADGCGGHCGDNAGTCGIGETCSQNQCVPTVSSPSNSPSAPPSATSSPPPPFVVVKPLTDPGSVAGAFFGGLFTALFVGGVGNYLYKRKMQYRPYRASDSAPPAAASGPKPDYSQL